MTSRPQILLVEDDEIVAAIIGELARDLAEVRWAASAERALELLKAADWDLVIADVGLPGISGIEFARAAKRTHPLVSVLILTADASFRTAVDAIRADADDFLTKPIDAATLPDKLAELIAATRERKDAQRDVVLAIGAHPDDVEIGCGGILLRHVARGDTVAVLTLTGGENGGSVAERAAESRNAADLMSARLFHTDLADTSVSEGGSTINAIKAVIDEIHPRTIYTHTINDVHQDHRNVHRATLVAARNVPRTYCYQAPSTTVDFRPARFLAIDDFIDGKLAAIRAYSSQVKLRRYLEEDLLRATARYWSRFCQARYAEPLEVAREGDVPINPNPPNPDTEELTHAM
jgi:LmbE family N-acetylglucosaminyl deacetylase/CheY-like chemotaxis protein